MLISNSEITQLTIVEEKSKLIGKFGSATKAPDFMMHLTLPTGKKVTFEMPKFYNSEDLNALANVLTL